MAITADVSNSATLQGVLASPSPGVSAGVVPPITAYVEK